MSRIRTETFNPMDVVYPRAVKQCAADIEFMRSRGASAEEIAKRQVENAEMLATLKRVLPNRMITAVTQNAYGV